MQSKRLGVISRIRSHLLSLVETFKPLKVNIDSCLPVVDLPRAFKLGLVYHVSSKLGISLDENATQGRFGGVSFDEICRRARQFRYVDKFHMSGLALSESKPVLLADNALFLPVLGIALHSEDVSHDEVDVDVAKSLVDRLAEIEAEEEWGLDIDAGK